MNKLQLIYLLICWDVLLFGLYDGWCYDHNDNFRQSRRRPLSQTPLLWALQCISLSDPGRNLHFFCVWLQARRGLIIVHCEWVPGTASCSLPEAARCLCGANTHSQNAGGQEREARMGGEISTSVSVFYCHACLFVCGCNPNIVLDSYTLGLRRHPVDNQDWAARSGKTELPNFDSVGLLNDV